MSSNNSDIKGIKAEIIIEVMGKPAEHLVETLEKLISEMEKEKGVKILRKKINESKEMEEGSQGFFTNFAEIEIEVEEIIQLAVLMFKYMPAHIEITSPEVVALTSHGWNEILNELVRRLHGYDEIARVLQVEKNLLEKKFRDVVERNSEEKNIKKKKLKK